MGMILLYYLLAFFGLIGALIGINKWATLPQPQKDKVGLVTLLTFFSIIIAFILLVVYQPNYLKPDSVIEISMLFFFLFVVLTVFFIRWYNDKYGKKIDIGQVVIAFFLSAFFVAYLFIKYGFDDEKQNIISNIELKTVVKNITFDTHKPYFKNMTLADGQYLPMPETMNKTLQLGDSIYKKKGEKYYTVVNAVTKNSVIYEVKVHVREMGKAK